MLVVNTDICLGAGQGTPPPRPLHSALHTLSTSGPSYRYITSSGWSVLGNISFYVTLCISECMCVCVCICACIGKAEGLDWTAQSTIYTITLLDGHQLIPRCWSLCHCGSDLNGQIGFTKVGLSNWDANMLFLGSPQWHGLCKTNAAVCSYGELDGKMSLIRLVCQNSWSPATGASLEGGDSLRR